MSQRNIFGAIMVVVVLSIASLAVASTATAGHLEDLPPLPSPEEYPLEDHKEAACAEDPEGPMCHLLTEIEQGILTVHWVRENVVLVVWYGFNDAYNETGLPGVGGIRALLCDLDPAGGAGVFCLVASDVEQWYWVSGPLVQLAVDVTWSLVVFIATNAVDLVDQSLHKNEQNAEQVVFWATQTVPDWVREWICYATYGEAPGCNGVDGGQPPLLPPPPFPPQ